MAGPIARSGAQISEPLPGPGGAGHEQVLAEQVEVERAAVLVVPDVQPAQVHRVGAWRGWPGRG